MINLIPKEEKKKMAKYFRYNLAVLFLVALDFCLLILLISMLPSYFLSSMKATLISDKLEIQKQEPLPLLGEQYLSTIKDVNNKLDLVENSEKNKFSVSFKVINALLLKKRLDIKITQILYENDPILGKKISITGIAPSRAVLLLFRQALEEDGTIFKNVDLPISNFVKGSDIEFYLKLVPS